MKLLLELRSRIPVRICRPGVVLLPKSLGGFRVFGNCNYSNDFTTAIIRVMYAIDCDQDSFNGRISRRPEFRGEITAISEHSSVYSEHKIANKRSHILVKRRSLGFVLLRLIITPAFNDASADLRVYVRDFMVYR